jgi:glycosyl transferase, family 25
MKADWDFFDRIYCISLDERPDRRREAQAQFAKVGLTGKVEFVIVKKHPHDCEQGIYESHMLCISRALQAGAEHILIFEDDIVFDRFSSRKLGDCIAFFSTHPSWHILFLGCMVKRSQATAHPSVVNVRYRSLTHAYAIHRRFARFLIRHPWRKVPFDDFLRDLKDSQTYAAYPSFAFQSDSTSDNQRYLPLDRWRRMLGGLQSLQKKNEFYHHHRRLIVGAHVLALLLVIWAIIR